MKNLLISPPTYSYDELGGGEYPAALLKLSTYLKSKGEEVSYFDFVPLKFFDNKFPYIDGDKSFKIYKFYDNENDLKSFKDQEFPLNVHSYLRCTGQTVYRFGSPKMRYYNGIDKNIFISYLKKNKPDKIWISSGITYGWKGTAELIEWCKAIYSDIPVVVGGIYPTLCPEHARSNTVADEIIVGEYGEIKNERMDYSILPNPPMYILRHLCKGCPNKCAFCSVTYLEGSCVKYVDLKSDIEEIDELSKNYNLYNIKLWGSNLLLPGKGKVFGEWLDRLNTLGKDFRIKCPEGFAPEYLTLDLCKKIKKAGFLDITIPMEDADDNFLTCRMKKNYGIEAWEKAVSYALEAGFSKEQISVPIIIGTVGQTTDNLEKARELFLKYGVKPIGRRFTPVPKSEWYEKDEDFKNMNLEHLHGALYPALKDKETYNRMVKYFTVFAQNAMTSDAKNKVGKDMDPKVVTKMAKVLLDIASQNEEIVKLLKDIKDKINNKKD